MALETGSFIDDLTITNPLGADAKNEGDDHIRLVKKVLKATFPGMAGAAWRVQTKSGTYTVVAGDNMSTINCTTALTLNLTAAATLGNQHMFLVIANGGAVTLDPNGAETINGAATVVVANGAAAFVVCSGTLFLATVATGALITTRGDILRGDSSGSAERLAVGATDTFLGSDGTDAAYVAAATQAEQETGTATNKPVTPGRQHFHDSAAKLWASVDRSGGTPSLNSPSYNITSVTDNGAGQTIVTIATDFSTAVYAVGSEPINSGSPQSMTHTLAVGSFKVKQTDNAGAAADLIDFTCWAFGDLS